MKFLVVEMDPDRSEFSLSKDQSRRLRKVLRYADGATISLLAAPSSTPGQGTLSSQDEIVEIQWGVPSLGLAPPLTVCMTPLKGDRLERSALSLFELGVKRLCIYRSERTQWAPTARLLRRLDLAGRAACEQSGRLSLPTVYSFETLKDCLAQTQGSTQLCFQPQAEALPGSLEGPVTIWIGPEGGFSSEELKFLASQQVQSVGLGGHILRAETAGIVASTLVLRSMSWL